MKINEEITTNNPMAAISVKPVLTSEEAAMFLGYKPQTLRALCMRRKVPYYKKGHRLYFKKSELEAWMTSDRRPTHDEVLAEYEKKRANKKHN